MRLLACFILFILSFEAYCQELQTKVNVNTQKVNQTNKHALETLARDLENFINRNQWTETKVDSNEKIVCVFNLTVNNYQNNVVDADLHIQSYRPVYGTSYDSNILNYSEKAVKFSYLENEPIYFNESTYTSELASTMAFYAYIIIGLDADSFKNGAGRLYFRKAMTVVQNAQVGQSPQWVQSGENNRWRLCSDLISDEYEQFHDSMYKYHREGLDTMAEGDIAEAKQKIKEAIMKFKNGSSGRLNNWLLQMFLDAKAEEIGNIFSAGDKIEVGEMKNFLESVSPVHKNSWEKIK